MTIIMESTYLLLAEKDKKEAIEKGTVKELKNKVRYLIIE